MPADVYAAMLPPRMLIDICYAAALFTRFFNMF